MGEILLTNIPLVDTQLDKLDIEQEIEWFPSAINLKGLWRIRPYIENDEELGTVLVFKKGGSIAVSAPYVDMENIMVKLAQKIDVETI